MVAGHCGLGVRTAPREVPTKMPRLPPASRLARYGDVPGASFTEARGINAQGDIVGVYTTTAPHGFLLHEGTFTTIDVPGASSTTALSVSPNGGIVGYDVAGGVPRGFVARIR